MDRALLEVIAQLDEAAAAPSGETETAANEDSSPFQKNLSDAVSKDESSAMTTGESASLPEVKSAADFKTAGLAPSPASAKPTPAPKPRPARTSPPLAELLRRSGLSELALGRLQEMPIWPQLTAAPLHRALAEIGRHLQEESARRWAQAPLSRTAFLGTPGVGRTTAMCKWLGSEVFRRARSGHVILAEFDRPNSPGPLPVFCEALGVPVVRHPASTHPTTPGGFVYFDLPGISLRDPSENSAISAFLAHERITQRVLVLNAAYDHSALRTAYAAGRSLGATHLVFTHLDEVPQWGKLWDYLLDGALEPLFLATGPSLTGDCEEDVFGLLVRRTLAGNPQEPPKLSRFVDDRKPSPFPWPPPTAHEIRLPHWRSLWLPHRRFNRLLVRPRT